MARIARGWFKEGHATGFEWREFLMIENRGGALAAIAAVGPGPFIHAAEIRLAVGGTRQSLGAHSLGGMRKHTLRRYNQPRQQRPNCQPPPHRFGGYCPHAGPPGVQFFLVSGSWLFVKTCRP